MKNILTESLPDSVTINGKKYPIYVNFKNWIKIDLLMADSDMRNDEKLAHILCLCYKRLPPSLSEAVSGISYFYSGGCVQKKQDREKTPPCFDFSIDGELIYAAFYTQYGIDLIFDDLHWWQFLALLRGLGSEHKFSKAIEYRLTDLTTVEDNAKKRFYRKMKELYKLPDKRTRAEKDAFVAEGIASLF